jgi:bacillithiol system protein YtxJ
MGTTVATRFVPVPDTARLDAWLARADPAVLFLHDPGCPISRRAYREMAGVGGEAALLDVRANPALADEVERRTGVRHESPQAIVLADGRAVWSASHGGVTELAVRTATASGDAGNGEPRGAGAARERSTRWTTNRIAAVMPGRRPG